jgi:hypothetical protein
MWLRLRSATGLAATFMPNGKINSKIKSHQLSFYWLENGREAIFSKGVLPNPKAASTLEVESPC